MSDSVGSGGFPKTGIQEGHLHFDKANNIVYVYNGGNASDSSNWSRVGGSGSGIGNQRWFFRFVFGPFLSKQFFVVPIAGRIVRWGAILTDEINGDGELFLEYDPFGVDSVIGTITIPTTQNDVSIEQDILQVVNQGDIILVIETNISDPEATMSGFIDFVPN